MKFVSGEVFAMRKAHLIFVCLLFCGTAPAWAIKPHPQFSADVKTTLHGRVAASGKYYMGGNGMRMEVKQGGILRSTIFRFDENLMWLVMPNGAYMEARMDDSGYPGFKYDPKFKCDEQEKVGEWLCNKCILEGKTIHWMINSGGLKGLSVKMCDIDMNSCTELSNIKAGPQPESYFARPAGQKMDMSKMPFMPGMGR